MMTQRIGLTMFLIKVLVLIKSNMLVRSVCLPDVLTFYYNKSDAACQFNKDDFNNLFNDNTARCHLFDCSVHYYPNMESGKTYEIEELTIQFETEKFILEKPCSSYPNDDVYVTVNCEGKYIQEQDLGGQCSDNRQCKRVNPYSLCSVKNKCECIKGYTKMNNTCLPERRLNETCDDDVQCSVVSPNSTCNKTTRVCTCTEGHLEMMNMCVHGRFLMEEISQHCKRLPLTIDNLMNKDMEQICSMYSKAFQSSSEEAENKSIAGLVIGVGIAGLVIGIAVCGAVYVIMTRHKTNSQKRINTVTEKINQPRSVEVSNAVYSKPIQHEDKRVDSSIVVGDAVYNHLHEDHSEISMQPDYDHVPQLGRWG